MAKEVKYIGLPWTVAVTLAGLGFIGHMGVGNVHGSGVH